MNRWLERHNSKLREGGKKEEKKRLKQFVEDAYKRDPRVIAHTEFKKNER
jgi:DnaJ family protein C protein 2